MFYSSFFQLQLYIFLSSSLFQYTSLLSFNFSIFFRICLYVHPLTQRKLITCCLS
ncbi:hypothetical protein Lalb_Chr15g0089361 [Lupinus albus]|uniref:Uncharacterized protein n=1 Tax=Lupinus albus TaxID=3870 RepID=A0A6A4P8C3_LUPAL|nr:hypothetical protein Lalb_Chr15g0089361 [Lupinus albus]